MISADPDAFFGHFLDTWTVVRDVIPTDIRDHYLSVARRPAAIHAACDDYRASAFIDGFRDEHDQHTGRQLTMPVLTAWQDPGEVSLPFHPRQISSTWAPNLHSEVMSCGHFLPEEQPDQ